MTQWTITVDNFADPSAKPGTNANAVGIVGPRGAKLTKEEIVAHPEGKKFRMLDDDRVVYYEGVLVGDDDFAPLDDFGAPNAGCVDIQYYCNCLGGMKWESL